MELTVDMVNQYSNKQTGSPAISIYIPTHPNSSSQSMNEDRIRYKNALQELDDRIAGDEALKDTYAGLTGLLEDNEFWLHRSKSLAVLADKDGYETIRLPYELASAFHFGDVFAVSPLAIMNSMNHGYYVLDISFKKPVLYLGSAYGLQEVDAGLPGPIDEELDITVDRQSTVGSRSGASGSNAIFYGHNEADNSRVREASRYLRMLADIVDKYLTDKSVPLLLAGSPKVVAEYKTIASYQHIAEAELTADYDALREQQLFATALSEIESLASGERAATTALYHEVDIDRRVDGPTAVLAAAEQGKVDTLLLPVLRLTTDSVRDLEIPELLVELPQDFAAFDEVVKKVLDQSGKIVPVESSEFIDDPSMKAILRF